MSVVTLYNDLNSRFLHVPSPETLRLQNTFIHSLATPYSPMNNTILQFISFHLFQT